MTTFHRRRDAAKHLHEVHGLTITPERLNRLASQGKGPPMVYLDNYWPMYPEDELDAWARSRVSPSKKARTMPLWKRIQVLDLAPS